MVGISFDALTILYLFAGGSSATAHTKITFENQGHVKESSMLSKGEASISSGLFLPIRLSGVEIVMPHQSMISSTSWSLSSIGRHMVLMRLISLTLLSNHILDAYSISDSLEHSF